MEIVKQTNEYTILKKRSGRYGVRSANKKWISGEEKVKILLGAGLIKAVVAAKKEEPAAPEAEATKE
ncbi:MAG: hypothetical protein HOE90_04645 [Bacteriovoracaceae bacterium]|jgi:hypothetical protein|nr:hypothetical protein [Bacteriovoracaceae bacterium]